MTDDEVRVGQWPLPVRRGIRVRFWFFFFVSLLGHVAVVCLPIVRVSIPVLWQPSTQLVVSLYQARQSGTTVDIQPRVRMPQPSSMAPAGGRPVLPTATRERVTRTNNRSARAESSSIASAPDMASGLVRDWRIRYLIARMGREEGVAGQVEYLWSRSGDGYVMQAVFSRPEAVSGPTSVIYTSNGWVTHGRLLPSWYSTSLDDTGRVESRIEFDWVAGTTHGGAQASHLAPGVQDPLSALYAAGTIVREGIGGTLDVADDSGTLRYRLSFVGDEDVRLSRGPVRCSHVRFDADGVNNHRPQGRSWILLDAWYDLSAERLPMRVRIETIEDGVVEWVADSVSSSLASPDTSSAVQP